MFGWLRPRPPLDTGQKTWTEMRLRWLVEHLGLDRVRRVGLLRPDDPILSAPITTDTELRRLFERLGAQMGVATGTMELAVYDDRANPDAPEVEETASAKTIWVPLSLVADPTWLVATLAHDLARSLLDTLQLPHRRPEDSGTVIGLVPVLLGVGVFTANASGLFVETEPHHRCVRWNRWAAQGETLAPPLLGYALAVFADLRDEEAPAWASWLRFAAADTFRSGLRYIRETGDSLCRPASLRSPQRPLTLDEALSRMEAGTPSERLANLWRIREERLVHPRLVAPLAALLKDRDNDIAAGAAAALAIQAPLAQEPLSAILTAMRKRDTLVRKVAAARSSSFIPRRPSPCPRSRS